jgi:hypothetical protein
MKLSQATVNAIAKAKPLNNNAARIMTTFLAQGQQITHVRASPMKCPGLLAVCGRG